ncbi:DUF1858 domain-containing protein [Halanaerobaculum tunisiense]
MKIDKDTSIAELLVNYPAAKDILEDYGLGCAKCLGAITNSLESAARANNTNLTELIERLQQLQTRKEE